MNAVISGTAGRALLIDGKSLKTFDVDDPSNLVVRHQSDLPYLFGEGRDLRVIENAELDSIVKELKSESDLSLALDLTLISLDEELEDDIRKDAIQDLDELFTNPQVTEHLERIMYARPLPDDADVVGALKFCDQSRLPNSFAFFEDLDRRQPLISKVSASWDIIPTKVFGDYERQSDFQRVAVREGLFRSFVITLERPSTVSRFLLNAGLNSFVQQLRNYRQVLQQWSTPFRAQGKLPDALPAYEEVIRQQPERTTDNLTILLVEDDEDTRFLMRLELERRGYRLIEAEDGEKAVELAQEEHPDIILMDISLPRMDGLEASKLIRNHDQMHAVPIIIVTAHQESAVRQEAKASGLDAYVTKPIDFDWLSELMTDLIA